MAKVIDISPANAKASTTVYNAAFGSGSLRLNVVAEQAGKPITLEGQKKDVTTAGLARINMILYNFSTANIQSGTAPATPKFKDGEPLRTYDRVVANPPFSDKTKKTPTPANQQKVGADAKSKDRRLLTAAHENQVGRLQPRGRNHSSKHRASEKAERPA